MLERNIAIRVDEELFKKIKVQLADNGMTMKDYIISLIEEDLKKMHKYRDKEYKPHGYY